VIDKRPGETRLRRTTKTRPSGPDSQKPGRAWEKRREVTALRAVGEKGEKAVRHLS